MGQGRLVLRIRNFEENGVLAGNGDFLFYTTEDNYELLAENEEEPEKGIYSLEDTLRKLLKTSNENSNNNNNI